MDVAFERAAGQITWEVTGRARVARGPTLEQREPR